MDHFNDYRVKPPDLYLVTIEFANTLPQVLRMAASDKVLLRLEHQGSC